MQYWFWPVCSNNFCIIREKWKNGNLYFPCNISICTKILVWFAISVQNSDPNYEKQQKNYFFLTLVAKM